MTFMEFVHKALVEAILPGVSSILSFFPAILLAVFILSLLRSTGVIKPELAPFIIGFSCSVPAILSCNTITDKKTRILTALLIPYMSCSAKLPVYILLASAFFPAHSFIVIMFIYFTGILFMICILHTANHTAPTCISPVSFSILNELKTCCVSFTAKAFTIIPATSFIIWLLMNLDPHLKFTSDINISLLAHLGRICSPAFVPLGFGDWRAVSALITGLCAKETIVSTFTVITKTSDEHALYIMLGDIFTPASSISFMVFCLFYIPCIATLTSLKSISGNDIPSVLIAAAHTLIAWVMSLFAFHLAQFFI